MNNLTHKFSPLSAQQLAEITALKSMPDSSIDYSDIPPLTEAFWQNATQRFAKPVKKSTTVRFDADVLQWLKSKGSNYQAHLNAILRSEMLKEFEQTHG